MSLLTIRRTFCKLLPKLFSVDKVNFAFCLLYISEYLFHYFAQLSLYCNNTQESVLVLGDRVCVYFIVTDILFCVCCLVRISMGIFFSLDIVYEPPVQTRSERKGKKIKYGGRSRCTLCSHSAPLSMFARVNGAFN